MMPQRAQTNHHASLTAATACYFTRLKSLLPLYHQRADDTAKSVHPGWEIRDDSRPPIVA